MKHPLIIRSLQYPLVGFLAIVTALVVVYPTYWERVAAAASVMNPSQLTSVSPWTEQERDEARERARLAITLPPLRLDQVDVGDRADMETVLETLNSETVTEVHPIQVDTLPAGGVLSDAIVHALDQWSFAAVDFKNSQFPNGLACDTYLANAAKWIASGVTGFTVPSATTNTDVQPNAITQSDTLPVVTTTGDVVAADTQDVPAQAAVSVVITNDPDNKLPVAFLLNDKVQTLQPGESISLAVEAKVRFDRGGELGIDSKTLTSGNYRFRASIETGWRIDADSAN